jgi:hypothetical protein
MSHDKSGTVTRKERRKANKSEFQAAARAGFRPTDYIREDWSSDDVIHMLETRAVGYNGLLRELFCTAANYVREYQNNAQKLREIVGYESGPEDQLLEDMEMEEGK